MKRSREFTLTTVFLATLVGGSGFIFGQDPFGADPFGTSEPAPAAVPEPIEAESAVEETETDPVITAIREMNPSLPEDLTWAIQNVLNRGRPDEVKRYAQQLLESSPDQAALAALQRKFGSALFLRLVRDKRLDPEGVQLGRAVLDAAYQVVRDPARLRSLIEKLTDPAPEVRHTARVDLREAEEDAAVALIEALADPDRQAQHAAVREALVGLGRTAEAPLVAALASDEDLLNRQIVDVLGRLRSATATPFLLRPLLDQEGSGELRKAAEDALMRIAGKLPSRSESIQFLSRHAKSYLDGETPAKLDLDDLVTVWTWNAAKQTCVAEQLDARSASLRLAVQIAGQLYALDAKPVEHRRLYLTALLESAKLSVGLDQPLRQGEETARGIAVAAGEEAVEDVLGFAIDEEFLAAAIAALELLGEIGDERLLDSRDGRLRRVASALRHPDRRVRFAAAAAILRWDPGVPYPGSSFLPPTLAYFARTGGTRRVLIGHPRTEQAQTLVGMLNELGFEADMARTGRNVLQLAMASPDLEFLLLSDALDSPPVEELTQQLRREPLTAMLPIGVMTRETNFPRMKRVTESDALTATLPRAYDETGAAWQVRHLLALSGDMPVGIDQRLRHAEVALDYLARIAERPDRYPFYDVLGQQDSVTQALYFPALTAKAARVLGLLGSPDAQRVLVTLASQNARRLSQRQAAAVAFSVAVRRRGLLLSRQEILTQYDRYNQSADLDRETQKVLGRILDAIEAPSQMNDETDNDVP